jgi:hypothetical protein
MAASVRGRESEVGQHPLLEDITKQSSVGCD